jgi:hypothetical protein
LETIAGIQQGFEELERGQTRPIGDFIQKCSKSMTFQVEITPIAEAQIEQAYLWYRELIPNLRSLVSRVDERDCNAPREAPALCLGSRTRDFS